MGKRGPQPGFKKAKQEGAAKPLSSIPAEDPKTEPVAAAAQPPAAVISDGDAEYASWMVAQVTAPAVAAAPAAPVKPVKSKPSAADLENPEKLKGNALRELAHRRGIARSALEDMSDDKIRRELHLVTNRQYSEEPEPEEVS